MDIIWAIITSTKYVPLTMVRTYIASIKLVCLTCRDVNGTKIFENFSLCVLLKAVLHRSDSKFDRKNKIAIYFFDFDLQNSWKVCKSSTKMSRYSHLRVILADCNRIWNFVKVYFSGFFNFNPYPWILDKIQNAGPSASVFCGKKSRAQRCVICICFRALDFPRKTRSVMVPKNYLYVCSARHIFPHIGICHLKLVS